MTLAEFFSRAEQTVPAPAWEYYLGGAGDEVTVAENVADWRRLRLRQRVLVDVSARDVSVRLLGRERPTPYVIAPMAYQREVHPGGEAELASGAAQAGAVYTLSTLATCGIGELAAEVPRGERWFQLYVFRDRGVTRAMLEDAERSGYEAIVVTADLPIIGIRDRERLSGFRLAGSGTVPNAAAAGAGEILRPGYFAADLIDASLTWDDLAQFVADARLPVLVKGVLDPDDALRAVDAGVAGIIVSNHGGRQLDTVQSTARALPAVVDAVRGAGSDVDVIVDGGLRRGGDVAKALALGATAVGIGRPAAAGLAVGGRDGVVRVLDLLTAELHVALALVGVPRARDLDAGALVG